MDAIDKKYAQQIEQVDPAILVRLELRMHDNGAMSIIGPIDNHELCIGMLEHALDTIKGRQYKVKKRHNTKIEIPNRDVVIPVPEQYQR